jgi:hypothetical protein
LPSRRPGSREPQRVAERAYGKVPRKRGRNQTLIASTTLEDAVGEALSAVTANRRIYVPFSDFG